MNQLNSIILEGNLVKDAELLEPVSGFKVCKFAIGVNRYYKNKKDVGVNEVSFFDVETFGKTADYCLKKASKGRGVRVVGRLKQETWKDDAEKTHSRVFVIGEQVEFKPVYAKEIDDHSEADDMPDATETDKTESFVKEKQLVEEEAVF